MQYLITILVMLGNVIYPAVKASAGANVQILDPQVEYTFGQTATFHARVASDQPVRQVTLFFQSIGGEVHVDQTSLNDSGVLNVSYNLRNGAIRPFSRVYYWFQVENDNGNQYTSPSFTFDYVDSRFEWQYLESGSFNVHWYQGDLSFAQAAANTAQEGLANIQKTLPLQVKDKVDIYLYSSAADLQSTLQLSGQSWMAGSASPDLGIVMVSIPQGPDQRLELERQIPHELDHVLLYQAMGSGYAKLPIWLTEGLASLAELYPNPDYQRTLDAARQSEALLPIESLCQTFPQDASGAFLAYAEASSFTRYLRDTYGTSGLQSLLQSYANGLGCTQGIESAFGVSLRQLDTRWRSEALSINMGWVAAKNLLPYVLLLLLLLVVMAIPILNLGRKSRKVQTETKQHESNRT
jgi:hypothetical protein